MAKLGSNYWKLWTTSAVSNLGDGVSTIAYPWLASAITRDPVQISLIAVATRLPWLIFTLPAGVITDRVDRRKIMVAMDTLRFALTIGVAFVVLAGSSALASPDAIAAGTASPPAHQAAWLALLYVTALAFGFAEVLRDNAAQTIMPAIVEPENLEPANGRLWGAEMVMNSLAGPPIGGLLIAVAFSLPFFVDAGTFAVSAVGLLLISGSFRSTNGAGGKVAWRAEISEGVRWLWRHNLLRSLAIILGVMNAMFSMALATYVLFVQEILHLDAAKFGLLMTAGAIGGAIGSVVAPRVSKAIGSGTSLFLTLAGSCLTLAVTGLVSSAAVVWAMFLIGSFLAVLWNVITVSLRQTIIPEQLLGRVNSVYRFFAWGMIPIGSFLGGVVVDVTTRLFSRDLGLRMPFLLGAAAYFVVFLFALPRLTTAKIEAARSEATVR
jgi:MFS family permease